MVYFQAAGRREQNDSLKPSSIDLTAIHMDIDEVNYRTIPEHLETHFGKPSSN